MKLESTLILLFITLFCNNIYSKNLEVSDCNKAIEKGDAESALFISKDILNNNKNDKDAYICQGRAFFYKSQFNEALAAYKSANALSSSYFDKTISSLLIGNAYKSLKQNDQAVASFEQTISNAKAFENKAFERIGYNAIGDVYFDSNQYVKALEQYELGNKISANDNERGESYEKIAIVNHLLNQNDLALEYQIKAYLMNEKVGSLDQYAHSSIQLGRYYAISKNYISAENVLNKIIKFAKEQGGAYYEAQGSYVLAKVKFATEDKKAANDLIAYAKSIALKTHDKALEEEINLETRDLF